MKSLNVVMEVDCSKEIKGSLTIRKIKVLRVSCGIGVNV